MKAHIAKLLANNPEAVLSQMDLHEEIVQEQQTEITNLRAELHVQRAAKQLTEKKLTGKLEECAQLRMAFIRLEADQRRQIDILCEQHASDLQAMGEVTPLRKRLRDMDHDLMHTVALDLDGKPRTLHQLYEDGYTDNTFTRVLCVLCQEPACQGCGE